MASCEQAADNQPQSQASGQVPGVENRPRFYRPLVVSLLLAVGGLCLGVGIFFWCSEQEAAFSKSDSAASWAAADQPLRREALELADRLVRDLPGSRDALDARGWLLNGWGNNVEAVKCWEACLKLDPTFGSAYECIGRDALNRAEYEKAASLLSRARELDPTRLPETRLYLAQALMNLNRPDEAAGVLEEQIALWPGSVDGYCQLGQAQFQRQAHAEAKSAYEAALQRDPQCRPAWYGLALACDRLGETQKASEYRAKFQGLEKAFRAERKKRLPEYDEQAALRRRLADDYTRAGRVYLEHGKLPEAEECWRKAAATDRKHAASREVYALFLANQDRMQETLPIFRELRQIEPENPLHCMNLGFAHMSLQQLDAAEAAYQAAVDAAPNNGAGYAALAEFYLQTGRNLPEAVALARKAVERDPTAGNYFLLSQACAKHGDHPAALTAARRATELEPGNALYAEAYKQIQSSP